MSHQQTESEQVMWSEILEQQYINRHRNSHVTFFCSSIANRRAGTITAALHGSGEHTAGKAPALLFCPLAQALQCAQRCRALQSNNWRSLSCAMEYNWSLSALYLSHSDCSWDMPYEFWEQLSSSCGFNFKQIHELILVKTWLNNFISLFSSYYKDTT